MRNKSRKAEKNGEKGLEKNANICYNTLSWVFMRNAVLKRLFFKVCGISVVSRTPPVFKKTNRRRTERKLNGKSRVLATPYLAWMAIFIIVPLVLIAVFAFTTTVTVDEAGNILTDEDISALTEEYTELYGDEGEDLLWEKLGEKTVFTLDNITAVSAYMPTLINSIVLAFIATLICLVAGYPLSFILSRLSESKQRITVMFIMLPMWMNFLLRTYAWMTILENNGLINKFFGLFGIGPFQLINTQGAVVLGMVYNYLPFLILPLYSVMTKIDNSTIEAARDLGAGKVSIFLRVILPMSTPGIVSGFSMVFVPAVSTFIISKMLGGGTNMLIGDLIDLQFLGNAYNPHLGSAISLVLMVFILVCMSITNSIDDEDMEGMII